MALSRLDFETLTTYFVGPKGRLGHLWWPHGHTDRRVWLQAWVILSWTPVHRRSDVGATWRLDTLSSFRQPVSGVSGRRHPHSSDQGRRQWGRGDRGVKTPPQLRSSAVFHI